ncbi:DNA polymerase V [Lachnospiraceae bacterium]|nr:DNA polymerase V [Lachnospiraceae bacterium]
MSEERKYIAIDLKSFYASVECFERGLDPLTTNLVVADESRTDKTICLAVSPSLKAYGISGRARLFEVKKTLNNFERRTGRHVDFIIAPPRMALYIKYSTIIYNTYLDFVSEEDIHVYSIDEVFIDVTSYLKNYKMTAHELAITMIRKVLLETGITATAGIGTNIYLAKIAMDIVAKHMEADSDGVRIAELDEMSYRHILWGHKPITDFWRIGRGTARRLAKLNIYTMGDLARESLFNEDYLYKIFGIDAEILIDHAWGIEPTLMSDIKNYHSDTKSLSSGQVLKEPYTTEKARIIVSEMTENLVLDMVRKGYLSESFTLVIGYDRESVDNDTYTGEVCSDYYGRVVPTPSHGTASFGKLTSSTNLIRNKVLALYDRIVKPDITIRRITIAANNLKNEDSTYVQFDIFTDVKKEEQEKKLQKAMIEIQDRFGKNAMLKGTDLLEGATAIERNSQIGGHRS